MAPARSERRTPVQSPALHGTARRLLTVTGMTGIAYTLSWIAGV
jgi:hypothetical protein